MQLPWPFLFIPERCSRSNPVSSIYNVSSNGTSDTSKSKAAGQLKKAYNSHEDKIKFTYMEQKEYETIDDDIASLEELLEKLDKDIEANATNSVKLREIMEQKEKAQADLDEKMDRWVYLNDLAERIEAQKSEK